MGRCPTLVWFAPLALLPLSSGSKGQRPVGDEVAPFSAARHSAIPATGAVFAPRAFGCGYAGLDTYTDESILLRFSDCQFAQFVSI